jgi:hypothetical protein
VRSNGGRRSSCKVAKSASWLDCAAPAGAEFGADLNNSYATINALRDAYHLRDWVWQDRLQHHPALLTQIIGNAGRKTDWESWVNQNFVNFPIVRDICNGSKHFGPGDKVKGYLKAGLNGSMKLDNDFKLDDAGFYVQDDTGRTISVTVLAKDVQSFWKGLFQRFPHLN